MVFSPEGRGAERVAGEHSQALKGEARESTLELVASHFIPLRHSVSPYSDRALDRPLWMSDVIPETTFIWRKGQRHRQLGHSRELKLAACNRFHELGMLPVGSFEIAEAKRPPWGSGAPPDLTAKLAICGGSRGAWSAAETCG